MCIRAKLSFRSFYGTAKKRFHFPAAPLPDAADSDVEISSDSDDEEYKVSESESESEEEVLVEEDSETETELESENEPTQKMPKVDPLFKWPKKAIKWTMPELFDEDIQELSINEYELCEGVEINRHSSAFDFYKLFVTNDLIESILEQTQLYNEWRNINCSRRKVKEISNDEIRKVIGIVLYMGIIKLPQRRMYWSPKTRVDLIASAMSINRFEEIVSVLHFNDNNKLPKRDSPLYNRGFKVQPIIDHFRAKFSILATPETYMSVDEQIVPFKGAHSLKRYLPKKPKKWGYKMWAMAGISGYVYDFELDGGLNTNGPPKGSDPPESCGESGYVVLRLSENLEPRKHQLFFDNYFASPELVDYLGNTKKIWALSTLNSNRSRGCPIPTEKEMKKSGRGHTEEIVDSDEKVVVTAWHDNKRVLMLSNYIGKDPVDTCQRFDRKAKKKIDVERPAAVRVYNAFMGGVDKADMLLSLYRTKYRSRKWYHRVAFHLFSLAVCNSWIMHKSMSGNKKLVDFLSEICISLITGTSSTADPEYDVRSEVYRSMRSTDIPTEMRHDKFNHWPILIDTPHSQRCKYENCNKKTKFQCTKCQVYLCVANNTCFRAFHGVE